MSIFYSWLNRSSPYTTYSQNKCVGKVRTKIPHDLINTCHVSSLINAFIQNLNSQKNAILEVT